MLGVKSSDEPTVIKRAYRKLICDWPNRPKQKVCYETGKSAQTEYQVLEYAADNTARVQLRPKRLHVHAKLV